MLPIARTTLSAGLARQAFRAALRPVAPRPMTIPTRTFQTSPMLASSGTEGPDPNPTPSEENVRADGQEQNMSPEELEKETAFIMNLSEVKNKTESQQNLEADKS